MLKFYSRLLCFFLLFLTLGSCSFVSSLLHDDQAVAKVGREKLYLSEVERMIPDRISPEDSAAMAERYIYLWAKDRLYAIIAEKELSKTDRDVSEELGSYRRSLMRYRYEQYYITEKLDTTITEKQINEFYDSNQADFELSRPILKIRFVHIMSNSPDKEEILDLLSSDDIGDLDRLETLARSSALRYFDNSDKWTDSGELARYFGVSIGDMMGARDRERDMIIIEPEGRGDLLVAYICDIVENGTAPLEYCIPSIRDIIISDRKNKLLSTLERDLLDNALAEKQFVIYER